ncbi:methyltransferase domain-containing protein, partial [bacterium]|nr:methyltransferase domain-containing protein [bacterium]
SLARQEADYCLAADIEALPFAADSFDTWWSNLTLQWCTARNVFDEAARVLRHGGRLAVSTLAPGTFHELRTAFSAIDPYRHTLAFSTPDEIGAALAAAGFHSIALSRETLNVYYPDLKTLLRAVKAIGANRIGSGRRKGMMGRTAWQALEAAYDNDDMQACIDTDVAFHQAIAEASHNTLIGHLSASLMRVVHGH